MVKLEDLLYLFVTFVPCILGSVAGIGGGIIIKPVLSMVGSLSASAINFMCACTIFAMSCMTLYRRSKQGIRVDMGIGLPLALGAIVGGAVGKMIFRTLRLGFSNENVVMAAQSGLLITLTVLVFIYSMKKADLKTFKIENKLICFLASGTLGVMSAFIGIGGGPFNVAVLYLLFSMDIKLAALNSVFIIVFSQSANVIFTILKGAVPAFNWTVFVFMVGGGLLGGFFGPKLSKRLELKHVNYIYNAVLILVIALAATNFIHYFNRI